MRPTIALCCILKDEIKNLPQLISSVRGCFDEIHLCDTGSTDGSIEWIKENAEKLADCPVILKHYAWHDDFASARNFSMDVVNQKSQIKTDYVMWMDLDDVMNDREKFIEWRNDVMMLSDFWFATYNYSFDEQKRPICQFARERVIRTSKKFQWEYPIHEGIIGKEPLQPQFCSYWSIDHMRTNEDFQKDFDRNVTILEKMTKSGELPTRLKFYYGKELHDKGKFIEASVWLDQIVDRKDLEMHDRILTYEYLTRCLLIRYGTEKNMELPAKALSLAMQALAIAPMRAEIWCAAADSLILLGKEMESLPFYEAARNCQMVNSNNVATALFSNPSAYTFIPTNQIAKLKFKRGDMEGALIEATECFKAFQNKDTEEFLKMLLNMKEQSDTLATGVKVETDEIVFTCLPNSHPYPFDENIYATKAMGGSETALIEIAKFMKKKTDRKVIVFNNRESRLVCDSGVEYRPSQELYSYFSKFKPDVHVSWRHNVKLTDAKTYLWSHDLFTPGGEIYANYEKVIALSDFHRTLLKVNQRIPEEKIQVSRNGIEPKRYKNADGYVKDENKIVWVSSPDRGLERAIDIVKLAREKSGRDLKLHIFYGIENLRKYGMVALSELIEKKMEDYKDWIVYHGSTEQKVLAVHQMEAAVWLYPANFLETYCISAIEAIAAKCYPLVRSVGALPNTLSGPLSVGMAKAMEINAETDLEKSQWADELVRVLEEKRWENIDPKDFDYSWDSVCDEFISFMGLEKEKTNCPLVSVEIMDDHISMG